MFKQLAFLPQTYLYLATKRKFHDRFFSSLVIQQWNVLLALQRCFLANHKLLVSVHNTTYLKNVGLFIDSLSKIGTNSPFSSRSSHLAFRCAEEAHFFDTTQADARRGWGIPPDRVMHTTGHVFKHVWSALGNTYFLFVCFLFGFTLFFPGQSKKAL